MEVLKSPIRGLRESKGMIQGDFALLIGCSKTHLSDIERGFADLTPRILEGLEKLGLENLDEIIRKQKDFVNQKIIGLLKDFKNK